MEEAISDEVESLKRDIRADSAQLIRQVEAQHEKQLVALDNAIAALQPQISSVHQLMTAVARLVINYCRR